MSSLIEYIQENNNNAPPNETGINVQNNQNNEEVPMLIDQQATNQNQL